MSSLTAIGLLSVGVALVIVGADAFFRALLDPRPPVRPLRLLVTVVLSGCDLENLAAGIAANAKGLPVAAAGTFLGGTTFVRRRRRRTRRAHRSHANPASPTCACLDRRRAFPTLLLDGTFSRLDGGVLLLWFLIALADLARFGRSLLAAQPAAARRRPILLLFACPGVLTLGGGLLGVRYP